MFLTAAAQNLLCIKLAAEMGYAVPAAWTTWFAVRAAAPAAVWRGLVPLSACCRTSRLVCGRLAGTGAACRCRTSRLVCRSLHPAPTDPRRRRWCRRGRAC